MERHWDMLRWLVNFMGENEAKWAEMKREREKDKKQRELEENWVQNTREEMIRELYEEEELAKAEKKTTRKRDTKKLSDLKEAGENGEEPVKQKEKRRVSGRTWERST